MYNKKVKIKSIKERIKLQQTKDITIIPPDPKYDSHIRIEHKTLNVAAYCRVSTRFEQQENSYEAQIAYYTRKIGMNKSWSCAGIYADEGKAATGTKFRSLDVKWGTPTPIQLQDPKYNVFVPVRAFGQFGIRISDSKMFLTKIVGTLSGFTSSDIIKYFRGAYLTKVKDDISGYLIKKKISVLEINAYINEISLTLKENILPTFSDYGIELVNFYVNDISVPEDDTAVIKLKGALAKKAEMDIIGYSYTQERSFDTLEGAATNQSSGSAPIMGAGLGLGMGLGLGNTFGGAFGEMGNSIHTNQTKECPHCCKQIGSDYNFCPFCGKDTNLATNQKVCPKCRASNNNGLKFCGQCGTSLIKTCPKCSEAVDDKQKFCPHCGNSLVKKCSSCGSELGDNLKYCSECGKIVDCDSNE